MNQRLKKIFTEMLSLPTAPYHEDAVAAYIRTFSQKHDLQVKEDLYGNLVIRYRNGNRPKPVVLSSHMDHPGFEVLGVDGHEVTAAWLGACDSRHFPGSRVMVISDGIETPGQVTTTLDQNSIFSIKTNQELKQKEGAFGFWNLETCIFNSDLISTKSADNLASCAVILATLERLCRQNSKADLWGLFTRAEEVGFIGAGGIVESNTIPKNVPIVVLETSKELPGAEIGNGPVIRVGDRLSTFDSQIEFSIHSLAKNLKKTKNNFRFQRQLMSGGTCEASLYMLSGLTVGALAFPLRNYHNLGKRWPTEEIISASDAESMIQLCTGLALQPPSRKIPTSVKRQLSEEFKSKSHRLTKKQHF